MLRLLFVDLLSLNIGILKFPLAYSLRLISIVRTFGDQIQIVAVTYLLSYRTDASIQFIVLAFRTIDIAYGGVHRS